jgi:L,D-transpeptidase catalytic domain
MRISNLIAPLTAATISALPLGQAAYAELLIKVDKSAQRMTVTVNGVQLYNWPVTTGGSGYDTPGGAFKPFRMEIDHYSDEYDNAPMPYSIFFTQTGNAIHGTYEQRNLGRAVSHGCVRLSVKNAATLWNLVKQEKMANTSVVIGGTIADAGPPPVARSRPLPLTPDSASYASRMPPTADNSSYNAPLSQYRPRYDENRPLLPFPFFFGR